MFTVLLNDGSMRYEQAELHFKNVAQWAQTHCPSFVKFETVDVSDVSYDHDLLAEYKFNDEQDVMLFSLKWL